MSIFQGYLWKVSRIYNDVHKLYRVLDVFWYDSNSTYINNDGTDIVIAEPIENINDAKRLEVISTLQTSTHYLKYENGLWTYIQNPK